MAGEKAFLCSPVEMEEYADPASLLPFIEGAHAERTAPSSTTLRISGPATAFWTKSANIAVRRPRRAIFGLRTGLTSFKPLARAANPSGRSSHGICGNQWNGPDWQLTRAAHQNRMFCRPAHTCLTPAVPAPESAFRVHCPGRSVPALSLTVAMTGRS